MSPRQRSVGTQLVLVTALFTSSATSILGQEPRPRQFTANSAVDNSTNQDASPALSTILAQHPLSWVLQYARDEQIYLERTVRDFTCLLAKRERVEGELQDYQYIEMQVREEIRNGDRVARPMAIYLRFLAPKAVAGRRVIYVDGQNDGKMLVRNGGKHIDYVVTQMDPYGESAQRESFVPDPRSGFIAVLSQMIDVL